jgi:hypothetical protein
MECWAALAAAVFGWRCELERQRSRAIGDLEKEQRETLDGGNNNRNGNNNNNNQRRKRVGKGVWERRRRVKKGPRGVGEGVCIYAAENKWGWGWGMIRGRGGGGGRSWIDGGMGMDWGLVTHFTGTRNDHL